MPPAIGAMVIIFFMIIGYFTSNNLYMVTFFAAMGRGVWSIYHNF